MPDQGNRKKFQTTLSSLGLVPSPIPPLHMSNKGGVQKTKPKMKPKAKVKIEDTRPGMSLSQQRLIQAYGGPSAAHYSARYAYLGQSNRALTYVNSPYYRFNDWARPDDDMGYPYSMLGVRDTVFVGTDIGVIKRFKGPRSEGERPETDESAAWNNENVTSLYAYDVVDMATTEDETKLAAIQKSRFFVLDLNRDLDEMNFYEFPHEDTQYGGTRQVKFRPQQDNTLAVSTRFGDILLYDTRQKDLAGRCDPFAYKKNGHKCKNEVRDRRVLGITALEWIDQNTLCTGAVSELPVKVWDVRKFTAKGSTRSMPVCTTPEPDDQQSSLKGVSSIVMDRAAGRFFALSLDGKIRCYSMSCPSFKTLDTFTHPDLFQLDFQTNLALLNNHGSYSSPLLACSGGRHGPILFPLSNNIQDKALPGVVLEDFMGQKCYLLASDRLDNLYTVMNDDTVTVWHPDDQVSRELSNIASTGQATELFGYAWARN